MRGPRVLTAALLSLASLSFSCASFARSDAFASGRAMGVVQSDSLSELSGIAASRRNPGVLWVHNDSGEAPRIYAINEKAELLGACNIRGAGERDWEDIAVGPGPDPNQSYLYIGDIGDNTAKYPEVIVYRVPEPRVDAATPFGPMTTGPADAIRLTYPDGPRDAETLIVDPLTRDIYVISKRELVPKVYRAAYPQSLSQQTKLEQVAVIPFASFPTGGDVSPDGRRVIIRGMFSAALWERPAGERPPNAEHRLGNPVPLWRAFSGKPKAIPVASEPQGEAICFDRKGEGYFTISEGKHPTLYYFASAEPNTPSR
ncbi:MAG: hypothetical protein NTZ17_09885 [Phycisphaerae bacterium]|nr:hypothetical protein [Phycisphaerae bacterium]